MDTLTAPVIIDETVVTSKHLWRTAPQINVDSRDAAPPRVQRRLSASHSFRFSRSRILASARRSRDTAAPRIGTGRPEGLRLRRINPIKLTYPTKASLASHGGLSLPQMVEHLRRDVTGKGVRLRLVECGKGEPVILLHGLFFDCTTWNRVGSDLCNDFRVIAPDLPGFGESEKPPSNRFKYSIPTFAEAIADVYGALELGRASLVGHGLGGAVALTLAAAHPELVARLVLIDSLCHKAPIDFPQRIAMVPFLGGLVFKQLVGRSSFRTLIRDSVLPSRARIEGNRLDAYYSAFNTPAGRGSALEALRGTADTNSLTASTRRIQAPTLVIWGRHDSVYPAGYGHRLAREIPGAGFELMDAGHAPQEELPKELAAIVGRFLRNERNAA